MLRFGIPCFLLLATLCNASHTLSRKHFLGTPDVAKAKVMSVSKVAVQTSAIAASSETHKATTEEQMAWRALFDAPDNEKKVEEKEEKLEAEEEKKEEPKRHRLGTSHPSVSKKEDEADKKDDDDKSVHVKHQKRHSHKAEKKEDNDHTGAGCETSYFDFEPGCLKHVRQLVTRSDKSYTDVYLEDHLRYACEMEKEFGMEIHNDGFKTHASCTQHAKDLHEARHEELATGNTNGYRVFCNSFYEHYCPTPKHDHDDDKDAARPAATATAAVTLLLVGSLANAVF